MTPTDLLTHIQSLGITLRLDGGTLRASPRALLTPGLQAQVREHKAALIALLTAPVIDDDPGPWAFHSKTLDADIWLCLTEADVAALRAEGAIAYLPQEIRALQAMRERDREGFADKLRAVHMNKEIWDTAIEEITYAQTDAP